MARESMTMTVGVVMDLQSFDLQARDVGALLLDLAADQSEWSQATFGKDTGRGSIGALKHLEKEAREAQAAPLDRTEYADCFLLILDASRRAGMTPLDLIREAAAKMVVNKGRKWGPKVEGQPTEHVRE
jgi:hypothetical protein